MPRPGETIQPDGVWRMEQFSRAYVKAVASVAGCTYQKIDVDIDSADVLLSQRSRAGVIHSPKLEVQLKSTSQDLLREDGIHFPLEARTYNDLRDANRAVPIILVVLMMPEEILSWVDHSEERLALRRCGYWLSLRDADPTAGATRTVILPRNQVFDAAALEGMFDRLAQGEAP